MMVRLGSPAILLFILALRLLSASAWGQSSPNWSFGYVPPPQEWNNLWAGKADVNNGTLTNPTISGGNASGTNVTATGSTKSRALANRFAEQINVLDNGAYGDTLTDISSTVSIASGQAVLTTSGSDFKSTDCQGQGGSGCTGTNGNKTIIVDGAGVQATTGQITAVPVTASGGSYAATPTVSFGSVGSGVGAVGLANMALQSGTVATGGAGCTNGSQTFTVSGGTLGTAATVTGTVSGNVLSGALTVSVAGSYVSGTLTTTMLAASTVSLTGGGCATAPTMTPSWGVGSITMAGYGINYPTSVTASLSGGSATLGTPTVTLPVAPMVSTIVGFTSANQVTLANNASTTLSSASQPVTWGHLDDAAFQVTWAEANTRWATGQQPVIYIPANNYMISQALPTFSHVSASIIGDGRFRTYIKLAPAYSGPVFSFSEAWTGGNNAWPGNGPTAGFATSNNGPQIQGITVIGDTSVTNEQDGIIMYDRNDYVLVRDFAAWYLNGRGFYAGVTLNVPTRGYMRESRIDEMYFQNVGGVNYPVFELNSQGTGDTTNNVHIYNLNMWNVLGPAFVMRNNTNSAKSTQAKIFGLRVESVLAGYTGDAVQLGDPTQPGTVTGSIYDLTVVGPQGTANGLGVYSTASGTSPNDMIITGAITGVGAGSAINLQSGRGMHFIMQGLDSAGPNVTTGGSAGGANFLDAGGVESTLTYNNTIANGLSVPAHSVVVPNINGFAANVHDGSLTGGSTIGQYAVDLQTLRAGAAQAATGIQSSIIGGVNNTASGNTATAYGAASLATGTYSFVGGHQAFDNSNYGWNCYSSGVIAAAGDNEVCFTHLKATATSTGAVRLTADAGAAGSANCVNTNSAGAYGLKIDLTAYDTTTPANTYAWYQQGLLNRTGVASTTAYAGTASPETFSTGSVSGLSVSATADTTNGCLNLSFTPPTGNSDTWHVGARVGIMRIK